MKRIFFLGMSICLLILANASAEKIDFETNKGWIAAGSGQGKFEIGIPITFSTSGGECKTTCLGTGPSGDHSEVGVNAACTNLDGHLAPSETLATNSLTLPVYNFSQKTNVTLELWRFMEIEGNNYDFCYYQYKNSPTGQWINLEKYGAAAVDDSNWVKYTRDLSSIAGGKSYFQLRFYCTTDDWTEGSGLCIDDITITGVEPCIPDCQGYTCGMDPVCGTLNCNNPGCTGGDKCENGSCVPCVPDTCASLGYQCGVHGDGCGGVTPNCGTCAGGDICQNGICRSSSKGIILVQLDDTSPEQLDTANLAVEKFHNEGIAITPELWPRGLSNSNLLNIALLWDSWPEVEIAQGIYSGSSPSKSYNSMVSDLQLGKAEYATVGVTQPTSYLPHMGYPTSSGLDALRYEGFLVVIDYVSPDRVRSGNPSNPSEMPLTIYDGKDIAEGGLDSYSTVLSSVRSQVAAKGYADLAFHVWVIDESMSKNVITMMKRLRDEEGYTFMTATEYYRFLWGGDSSCGNAKLETGEECDDGNLINGDGCSSDCKVELSACVDKDNDSYYAIYIGCLVGNDCNDSNNMIYPGASETECDGVNNDCDNLTDENYVKTQTTCGVGACKANGLLRCVDGVEVDSCIPGTPAANDATCNGIDNDCDGTNDEDYVSQPTTCGVGACYTTGSTSCVAGSIKDSCTPGAPSQEVCEGSVDEDCDGNADLSDSDCQICGDGFCSQYETCSSCPKDCGECLVKTLIIRPNGPGYRKEWTNVQCNSGVNEWQCVDEDPAVTTDYLRDTGTSKETFAFSDTGLPYGTINSITLFYYAKWHNNQANSCFEAMLRSNGRDYFAGTQMCVDSSWKYVSHKYTKNPSTNLTWTIAQVDALEAGMHSLNPNGGGRVAQVYAVVEYT